MDLGRFQGVCGEGGRGSMCDALLGAVLVALIRLANLWLNGRLADQRSVAVGSDLICEAYRRTPTEQEADGRGFPLSRPGHQPGGGVVPLIPCSA